VGSKVSGVSMKPNQLFLALAIVVCGPPFSMLAKAAPQQAPQQATQRSSSETPKPQTTAAQPSTQDAADSESEVDPDVGSTPEATDQLEGDNGLPVFRFRQPVIGQWLVLGPVPKDAAFPDPRDLLTQAAKGNEVRLTDGTTRTWRTVEANSHGYVSLDSYCKGLDMPCENAFVYAVVDLVASQDGERKFSCGADDAFQLWVDDQVLANKAPRWFKISSYSFSVDFAADKPKKLMMVAMNVGGDFGFGVEAGQTWKGLVTCPDGSTPNPDVIVEAKMADSDRRIATSKADASGRITFEHLPYESDVDLCIGGEIVQPKWGKFDSDPEQRFVISAKRPVGFLVEDLLPDSVSSGVNLHAIDYDQQTGRIFFCDPKKGNRISVVEGRNVYVSPLTAGLPNGLVIQHFEYESEQLFVQTVRHGVLVLHADRKVQFGGSTPIDGFDSVPSIDGWRLKSDVPFKLCDGVVYAVLELTTEQQEEQSTFAHAVAKLALSPGDDLVGRCKLLYEHSGAIDQLWAGSAGVAFAARDSVIVRRQDEEEFRRIQTPLRKVLDLGYDRQRRLCVVGTESIATMESDGTWDLQPAVAGDDRQLDLPRLQFTDDVWVVGMTNQMLVAGSKINPIKLQSSVFTSCPWNGQGILVGTTDGRIQGISRRSHEVITPADSIKSEQNWRVTVTPDQVVFSGKGMAPQQLSANTAFENHLKYKNLAVTHIDDKQTIAVLGGTTSTMPVRMHIGPKIYRFSDGKPTAFQLPMKELKTWIVDVVTTASGRTLIATKHGLFELHSGGEESNIEGNDKPSAGYVTKIELSSEEPTEILLAIDEVAADEVWLGSISGQICRLEKSRLLPSWISLPTVADIPRTATCFARVETDPLRTPHLLIGTDAGLLRYWPNEERFEEVSGPWGDGSVVQDIEPSKTDDSFMIAFRNEGVYSLKGGLWSRVRLTADGEVLSLVWDVEQEYSGRWWFTTSDQFVAYSRTQTKPVLFVDEVFDGEGWRSSRSVDNIRIEVGDSFRARLSSSLPSRHAGFRYRFVSSSTPNEETEDWTYLYDGIKTDLHANENKTTALYAYDDIVEVVFPAERIGKIELQAFDRDHNFSDSVHIPLKIYLPFWRWQVTRWSAALLALAMTAVVLASVVSTRRARQSQFRAEYEGRVSAERNAREREGLLLRVCHDLRNPLHVVFACSDMLGTGSIDAKAAAPLLHDLAESMTYLSEQLLTYSRASRQQTNVSLIDVRSLIKEIERELLLVASDRENEVCFTMDDDVPAQIYSDRNALKEIASNLLGNAVKHCPAGEVHLRVSMVDGHPTISVKDTGPGIQKEELETIFDAFYQIDPAPESQKGFGLGLSICRSLAENLGGSIRAESTLGVGSIFIVTLPKEAVDVEVVAPKTQAIEALSQLAADVKASDLIGFEVNGRLLVIDDLNYVGRTVVQLMRHCGVDASYASQFDAIDVCERRKFDEILIDLNMQGKDGFRIAEELRERFGGSMRIRAFSESNSLLEVARKSPHFDQAVPKSDLFKRFKFVDA